VLLFWWYHCRQQQITAGRRAAFTVPGASATTRRHFYPFQANTMARDDWVAVVTDPGAEYTAFTELTRFELRPYLPQRRRRWRSPSSAKSLSRRYPLFPRYLLLPIRAVKHDALPLCRGLRKFKPILSDNEGRLWRCPHSVIEAIRERETRGEFDEVVAVGDKVQVAKGALRGVEAVLTEIDDRGRLSLLLPLFGGAKATVPQTDVARA
jgi:hypothetical protein